MKGIIYILHFSTKFSHAGHYVGKSTSEGFIRRLKDHREGNGANLTTHVTEAGIELLVGGLWEVEGNASVIERKVKKQKNAGKYCRFCSKVPKVYRGCSAIDPRLIPGEK